MGDDIDLSDLYLALNHTDINIEEAVTDVTVDRTLIEGASTVTVEVFDKDRALLQSGRLSSKNDIEIDGLYFRLKAVRKNGDVLELTFEDREVALLRTYAKPIKQSLKTSRGAITRAQFILRLIKEVKEVRIPYVIPELNIVQPIDGGSQQPPNLQQTAQRGRGIPKHNDLYVKTAHMNEEQRKNANAIIATAASHLLDRPVMVMAIMCAIQESTLENPLPFPTNPKGAQAGYSTTNPLMNPTGVFQQIALLPTGFTNWPASRDVVVDAWGPKDPNSSKKGFLQICVDEWKQHKTWSYGNIIEHVQNSGLNGDTTYGSHRAQAERIVDAYGMTDSAATSTNDQYAANAGAQTYEFYRGLPNTSKLRKQQYGGNWGPEDSWTCIQRLANEVQWRAFMVSGTFYYISEDDLFKSQPIATVNETMQGVISLDGNYDENSKVADLTLNCQMNRWAAPPGSIVRVIDMGPWNGRWLVNDVSKSIFQDQGTITLKKPLPRLPEPSEKNIIKSQSQIPFNFRKPPAGTGGVTKIPTGTRIDLAHQLLTYHTLGRWIDYNTGLEQIQRTAAGMMVSSPILLWVSVISTPT